MAWRLGLGMGMARLELGLGLGLLRLGMGIRLGLGMGLGPGMGDLDSILGMASLLVRSVALRRRSSRSLRPGPISGVKRLY